MQRWLFCALDFLGTRLGFVLAVMLLLKSKNKNMFGAHVFLKTSQKMPGLSGGIFRGRGLLDVPEMVARGGGG